MGCGGAKKHLPSFTARLANASKAVIRWGLYGMPLTDETAYRERLGACAQCDLLINETHCSHPDCGCPVARKARLATEECPLKKWLAVVGGEIIAKPVPAPKKVREVATREKPAKVDPATCSHRSPFASTHIDRRSWTATTKIVCRDCGAAFTINGQSELLFSVSAPEPSSTANASSGTGS